MSTTVLAGSETVADIHRNRLKLEQQLGIQAGATQFVSQIHSSRVVETTNNGWNSNHTLAEADAIISVKGEEPIAILVADCLPVAFTTTYGPTAIAHAGRVGLLNGVLENTVAELRRHDPTGQGLITATIGPSICGSCYEVPSDMQHSAAAKYPVISSTTTWGTPALDLPAAAEYILQEAGVNVQRLGICTYTNEQLYSHRRQPGAGRLAGFIWKTP